jgi:hypothetical protein
MHIGNVLQIFLRLIVGCIAMDELSDGPKDVTSRKNGEQPPSHPPCIISSTIHGQPWTPLAWTLAAQGFQRNLYKDIDLPSQLESRPSNSQPSNDTPNSSSLSARGNWGRTLLSYPDEESHSESKLDRFPERYIRIRSRKRTQEEGLYMSSSSFIGSQNPPKTLDLLKVFGKHSLPEAPAILKGSLAQNDIPLKSIKTDGNMGSHVQCKKFTFK